MTRGTVHHRSTLRLALASALLVAGLGLASPAVAQPHPAVGFLQAVPIGASADQLKQTAKKLGWTLEAHPWNQAGGMSSGLLARPGLLPPPRGGFFEQV